MSRFTVLSGGRSAAQRFEALVRPHFDALYRAAYRLSRSMHDAEDLVQEVCVRAYPRLEELERLDNAGHWLYSVMYRAFVDQHRRYERTHVRSIEEVESDSLISESATPEEGAERALTAERLAQAWKHMPREQQALLTMHDVEGYSLAEMQTVTGLKTGTLKSRLHRARIKLGKLLRREELRAAAGTPAGAHGNEMRRRG